jgi:hypothetical protein
LELLTAGLRFHGYAVNGPDDLIANEIKQFTPRAWGGAKAKKKSICKTETLRKDVVSPLAY